MKFPSVLLTFYVYDFFCQILLKTVTNAKTYFSQILIAVILILESNKNYNVNSRTLGDDCPISLLSKAAHVWWKVVKRFDRHLIFVVINDLPFSISLISFVGEDEWKFNPWFWVQIYIKYISPYMLNQLNFSC